MVLFSVNDSCTYLLFPLRRVTALNNKLGSRLASASFVTQRLLAPRCLRRLTYTMTTTVTTTMRVVNSVHNNTTNSWANTHVSLAASFTDLDVLVLFVADNTQASHAFYANQANFTTGQFNLC